MQRSNTAAILTGRVLVALQRGEKRRVKLLGGTGEGDGAGNAVFLYYLQMLTRGKFPHFAQIVRGRAEALGVLFPAERRGARGGGLLGERGQMLLKPGLVLPSDNQADLKRLVIVNGSGTTCTSQFPARAAG